ncbi:O-antigen ligase family protein [Benzoatithermus flavus]|uniref:O-antigen ligase family protein n=1 Tax=Benzoatithermus flavus TaxID=3108223 RepID=A0ABU8XPG0_9PROT
MARGGRAVPAVVAVLLMVLLAWAPVPLGSNRPWAWSLLAAWAGVLLLLWAVGVALAPPSRWRAAGPVALAGLMTVPVWAWAALQNLPAAGGPWAALAGWTGLRPEPAPIWAVAADVAAGTAPAVGLETAGGMAALMRLLAYGAVFVLAWGLGQEGTRARRILWTVLGATTACALYGLVDHFAGWETILGSPKTAYVGDVTGTFVNRNSFATYANLGIVVGLALLAEPFLGARVGDDLRRIAVGAVERLMGWRSLLVVALSVLVTASLQSHSRGGLLSLAVAVPVVLLLVFLVTRPRLPVAVAVVAATALAGWGVVQVSGETTLQRLERIEGEADTEAGSRMTFWQVSLDMVRERPWTGHGYGSYEAALAQRRDERFGPVVDKAHNTYIEHLVELGVPATLALYAGPVLLFSYALRGVFVRRREQVFALVVVGATVLVALHALVDFSLQIPAVAVTYAALLGIGVAQAAPSGRRGRASALVQDVRAERMSVWGKSSPLKRSGSPDDFARA